MTDILQNTMPGSAHDASLRRDIVSARRGVCFLSNFDHRHADSVASWITSDLELTWLAPGTPPPLTAEKVIAWGNRGGHRFLFWNEPPAGPIGYAELNEMPEAPRQMWIGHFLLDPGLRGLGYGTRFVRALLSRAFKHLGATSVLLVVFPENEAAIRCYLRSGMTLTGQEQKYFKSTRREHVFDRMAIERRRFDQLVSEGALPAEPGLYIPHLTARRPGPPVDGRIISRA